MALALWKIPRPSDELAASEIGEEDGFPQLPAQAVAGMKEFAAGAVIVREGDLAENFFIIAEGMVEVVYHNADDTETVIARLESGNYFGEIGLLEGEGGQRRCGR
ncbi:MAG: cyclic nucleotide-binding domain-containing protein [Chloroflexi bacterium]|nr:cyclic nucleotide-binding domain-containing protein [Chloroflexota bacterium]